MRWSEATRLALLAVAELLREGDAPVSTAELARRHDLSRDHLAKVLRELARRGVVASVRGARGGWRLAADPREVTLFDVVEPFESRPGRGGSLGVGDDRDDDPLGRLRRVLAEIESQADVTLRSVRLSALRPPRGRPGAGRL